VKRLWCGSEASCNILSCPKLQWNSNHWRVYITVDDRTAFTVIWSHLTKHFHCAEVAHCVIALNVVWIVLCKQFTFWLFFQWTYLLTELWQILKAHIGCIEHCDAVIIFRAPFVGCLNPIAHLCAVRLSSLCSEYRCLCLPTYSYVCLYKRHCSAVKWHSRRWTKTSAGPSDPWCSALGTLRVPCRWRSFMAHTHGLTTALDMKWNTCEAVPSSMCRSSFPLCKTSWFMALAFLWPPYVIGGPLYFCPVVSFYLLLLFFFA